MKEKTQTQKRVNVVLNRIKKMCDGNKDDAEMFSDALEEMLETLHNEDAFGTEGQCDPRGDFRDAEWSMKRVQGVG